MLVLPPGGSLYLLDDKDEAAVRAQGAISLQISLAGDSWAEDVGSDSPSAAALVPTRVIHVASLRRPLASAAGGLAASPSLATAAPAPPCPRDAIGNA